VKKKLSKTFYFHDVLKFLFKITLMNTSQLCKEEEHNNHQHMETKSVDNRFRPGGTTSPRPGVKIV